MRTKVPRLRAVVTPKFSERARFHKAYRCGGRAPKSPHVYPTILISVAAFAAISSAHAESGLASYYGGVGRPGELTCAHKTRPMGSMVTVSYQGRSVRCRVNDRGPFIKGRII